MGEVGNIISVDLCDPLKRITMLRTLSPAGTGRCIPCISPAHPQILRDVVSQHQFPNNPPQGKALHGQISYPTEKSQTGVKQEPFPCTRSLCATFTGQKGRKSHQPHPGMLRHGKVLIKQSWQSSVNPLWTFHQAWFSSCIMETSYKGQYLFGVYVNDCLEKIRFKIRGTITIHQNGSLETHVTKATLNINMCM